MSRAVELYNRLPKWAQNAAFSAAGWEIQRTRYGSGFRKMLSEFESHLGWSADQFEEWRSLNLQLLVMHAYESVPYYRKLMDEGGIDPLSVRDSGDLKRFPLLTKDMVKANPKEFISSRVKRLHPMQAHTSGTTGSGFHFLSTRKCQQAQFACFYRYERQHGIDLGTWQAQFSSKIVVPVTQVRPPFWRIDYPGRRYYMSAFHESPANMSSYYELIGKKRFEWLNGYPSLITILAQWMNERSLTFDFVRAVTTGAENLLPHQKQAIELAFGVKPIQVYAQTENVAIISQQPDGRLLVDEDFSIVEFLPANGLADEFQIVGTCLYNYATPLIRYCTNDLARLGDVSGPRREVIALDGRQEDYITLPDGTKVGKLDHVFKDTIHFVEAQIYQRSDYSIVLRVRGNKSDCGQDEDTAIKQLRDSIGDSVSIEFEYVDRLEKSAAHKLRFVVSDVSC